MTRKTTLTGIISIIIGSFLYSTTSISETIINNNNGNAPSTQQPCGTNIPATDPRVPPMGSYTVNTGNGSSQQVYTTGETKPYVVDNSCNANNNAAPVVQPYVFPGRGPRH